MSAGAGRAIAVIVLRRLATTTGTRREQVRGQSADELPCARILTAATAAVMSATTGNLANELPRETEWATRLVVLLLVTSGEKIERHATKTAVAISTAHTPRPVRRQNRLHCPVGVSPRLAAIRVRDDLGLRGPVRVVDVGAGSHARGSGLGRDLPLRDARRELDEVVLFARAIPLGYPAGGEWRGGIGRPALVAWGFWPRHWV